MKRSGKERRLVRRRLDAGGSLGAALTLLILLFLPTPHAIAGKNKTVPDTNTPDKAVIGKLPITELTTDEAILHALNRLAYGARPGDVERVRQMGLDKWIDRQLHPDSIDDSAFEQRLQKYPTLKMSPSELLDKFPPPDQAAKREGLTPDEYRKQREESVRNEMTRMMVTGEDDKAQEMLAQIQGPQRIIADLSMAKIERAVYSERQLEAVMEDFWFNHFNVFAEKGPDKWMLTSYERDTIRPRTLGKFEDLLLATAKSPAMQFYLDNWLSADPDAWQRHQREMTERRRRYQRSFGWPFPPGPGAQGNRAKKPERGLNENYGREVMELHTLGVDGGYTQQDVIEMAKCLTGWTIREPRRDPEFLFDERLHTTGKKVVLGRKFKSSGMKDGIEALKMLANHPSTAKFISTKLARHFVSDTPPQALVDRMAQTFASSHGDIRAVLKTMVYSPEFWSREAYRAKVKTPFELVASTARALDTNMATPVALVQWTGRMGEPLYRCQPPTGYSDKAETWVNTGALLNRLNFAMTMASGRVPGMTAPLDSVFAQDNASMDPQKALSRALETFLDGQASPQTRETLESRLNDPRILQAQLDDPVKQVNYRLISGLVLGAPEFQRR